jgi:hypothetical protein
MKTFVPKDQHTEKAEPVEFDLAGTVYTFHPGAKKPGPMLGLLHVNGKKQWADAERAKAMLDWLADGLHRDHNDTLGRPGHDGSLPFEECQACHLQRRLLDVDDPIDLDLTLEVVSWLMGEVAGRPTTSRSGS